MLRSENILYFTKQNIKALDKVKKGVAKNIIIIMQREKGNIRRIHVYINEEKKQDI